MITENKDNKEAIAQLAPDLDGIMKDGLQQFEITTKPPAAATVDDKQPILGAVAQPAAAAETKEIPPKKKSDVIPPVQPEPKRFTSHEEAEKGYKNLQSENTRTTQELNDLKKKFKDQETHEQQIKDMETAAQDFEKFATDRRTKLLDEIDALDPDDKEYRTKVAQAQARADKDILKAGQKITAAATITTEAPLPPANPAAAAATSTGDQPPAGSVVEYTKRYLADPEKNTGIAPDDVLFWTFAGQAPDKDAGGKDIPLEEQIKWAVEQTKQYHSRIIPPVDKNKEITDAATAAARNQSVEMPLGRTTANIPPAADAENNAPVSLSDAIDSANDLRRL